VTSTPELPSPGTSSEASKTKSVVWPFWLGLSVLAVTGLIVFVIQSKAHEDDFQIAFIRSTTATLIGSVSGLILLQIAARRAGRRFLIPKLIVAGSIAAVALLRFDGFNGEMNPRLSWRWNGRPEPPPMVDTVASARPESSDEAGGDATRADADDVGVESTAGVKPSAGPQSLGFLGNDRTGIVPTRDFAVPSSADDVKVLWNVGVGAGWGSFAVADSIAVTLEQRDREEWVTAYELDTGRLIWKVTENAYHYHPLGGEGPRSTPVIEGSTVYTQGATGIVKAIDLRDGAVLWSVDLLERAGWTQEESETEISWGRSGSPLLVGGLCVVPFGAPAGGKSAESRGLIALDKDSGATIWTAGEDQISYASPQLMDFSGDESDQSDDPVDQRQIVIVNEASISGHAVDDGQVLWSFDWDGDSSGGANCSSVVPAGPNRFLIGKGYGGGSALVQIKKGSPWSAEAIWTSTRLMKTKFNHPVVRNGVAYGLSNGMLEAVDLAREQRLWIQPRSGRFGQGQVVLADDVLVAQAETGEVAFCDANPDEYVERYRLPAMQSKTWNIPTSAGRYLLVRNDRQAFCFYLPERGSTL